MAELAEDEETPGRFGAFPSAGSPARATVSTSSMEILELSPALPFRKVVDAAVVADTPSESLALPRPCSCPRPPPRTCCPGCLQHGMVVGEYFGFAMGLRRERAVFLKNNIDPAPCWLDTPGLTPALSGYLWHRVLVCVCVCFGFAMGLRRERAPQKKPPPKKPKKTQNIDSAPCWLYTSDLTNYAMKQGMCGR